MFAQLLALAGALALAASNRVKHIEKPVPGTQDHLPGGEPVEESFLEVNQAKSHLVDGDYLSSPSSTCLMLEADEEESDKDLVPEGSIYAEALTTAIASTGPWGPTKWQSDKKGGLLRFMNKRNGCRSFELSTPVPDVAEDCGKVCNAMGSACEVFSLYESVPAAQPQALRRCCFGRIYVGTESKEGATCYRKKETQEKDFTLESANSQLVGVPMPIKDMGRAKENPTKYDDWHYGKQEHCIEKRKAEFPSNTVGDTTDAALVCRDACLTYRTAHRVEWQEPAWCEGISVRQVLVVARDTEEKEQVKAFQCCFFTHIGSNTSEIPLSGHNDKEAIWEAKLLVAKGHSLCTGCEYDCNVHAIAGGSESLCKCPGRSQGNSAENYTQSVLVGKVCSWCREQTVANETGTHTTNNCMPVDKCIDNEPGCEGTCVFNWRTLTPTCACEAGLVAKGTQCIPRGCKKEEGVGDHANRCSEATLNPCGNEPGGRCLSRTVPREKAFSMCQEMRDGHKKTWAQDKQDMDKSDGFEAAVVERVDACGKGEFIWCCAEFDKSHRELQVEQEAGNWKQFQSWAPKAATLAVSSVSQTTKYSLLIADKFKDAASPLKEITEELQQVSTVFQLAISLCTSGKLPSCASSGRGGLKGFASRVRTNGRRLLAFSRRIEKLLDMIKYGTSNNFALALIKWGTRANRLIQASWKFILRNKWKLLIFVTISGYSLVLANGMIQTASLQMGSNALVAQAFMKNVATRILCPLMKHPVIQGFVLKWVVQNILLNNIVVKGIEQSLVVLGPVRGIMSWWVKAGGASFSLSDQVDDMKKQFGNISVAFYMVASMLGNTIFNGLVSMLCGTLSVLTDLTSGVEKLAKVGGDRLKSIHNGGFKKAWNFLHKTVGSKQKAATAETVGQLSTQLNIMRAGADAVPLQDMLLAASKGLMTYESFAEQLKPFLLPLVGATGVLAHFGQWLGNLMPQILQMMGIDAGDFEPKADSSEEEEGDKVTEAIQGSKEALEETTNTLEPMSNDVSQFEEVNFDTLCTLITSVEQTVRKLAAPQPHEETCPTVGNGLLGTVKPNEIGMPLFESIDVDIEALW